MARLPPNSPNYAISMCELGQYMYSRYERDGQLNDLNEAVRACERGARSAFAAPRWRCVAGIPRAGADVASCGDRVGSGPRSCSGDLRRTGPQRRS